MSIESWRRGSGGRRGRGRGVKGAEVKERVGQRKEEKLGICCVFLPPPVLTLSPSLPGYDGDVNSRLYAYFELGAEGRGS